MFGCDYVCVCLGVDLCCCVGCVFVVLVCADVFAVVHDCVCLYWLVV